MTTAPFTLHLGDCLETLKGMSDDSVDSIVTDPPYGLSFMGKRWDYDVPSVEIWAECLRVLKPGGHLLAFAGTRTQHRMAVRIEDAGFEIRDMIAWLYGSGFPKSMDVSKAIDKAAGAERTEAAGVKPGHEGFVNRADAHSAGGRADGWDRPWKDDPEAVVRSHMILAPVTDAARQWQGWGTALKPALEPITVARKPLAGTVAANVLAHGTGALNIDGCRVPCAGSSDEQGYREKCASVVGLDSNRNGAAYGEWNGERQDSAHGAGRFPANVIHDGSAEVVALFPDSNGAGGSVPQTKVTGYGGNIGSGESAYLGGDRTKVVSGSGSAARFFYCAKASRADRNEGLGCGKEPAVSTRATMREREDADWPARNGNHHPTVKPTALMQYLCRLVTPPGGVVLDPFMGSGSTGKACMREGFQFVGCELSQEYLGIARLRIATELAKHEVAPKDGEPVQVSLFEMAAA
jgi:site-specific DNA-methyltransferase (adenine-specific)